MAISMDLMKVSTFGSVEASDDSLLRKSFQNRPAYTSIKEMDSFLVAGRKGSGKTAIFMRLIEEAETDDDIQVIAHTFDDYPWPHHERQAVEGVPAERRYLQSWIYLILIGVARLVLKDVQTERLDEEQFNNYERMRAFVQDAYGKTNPDFSQVFQPLKKKFRLDLLFKPTPVVEAGIKEVEPRELPVYFSQVNKEMMGALISILNQDKKYFVCFDEIDLGFDSSSREHSDRLAGLLLAAREVFRTARRAGKHLNPVVFMRSDILNDLDFEDKNKITSELTSYVMWNEDDQFNLRQLMEARFGALDGGDSVLVDWRKVFDEGQKIGQQSKYSYILQRTMMRPRDIIKYCNMTLAEYKKGSSRGNIFSNEHVLGARSAYSSYLKGEISDEIKRHFDHGEKLFDLIRSIGYEKFTLDDLKGAIESKGYGSLFSADDAIEVMFDFSIVGYTKTGGARAGSTSVMKYKDPEATLDRSKVRFFVHPGLKEALSLKGEYKKSE